MSRAVRLMLPVMLLGTSVLLGGCGSQGGKKEGKIVPGTAKPANSQGPAEPKAAAGAGQKAEMDGLSGLSAEDRALAEKQRTCPVTGEPLGSMGTPVKVTVKGQTVFLCCDGCKAAIDKDPDKYLAKLKAKEGK